MFFSKVWYQIRETAKNGQWLPQGRRTGAVNDQALSPAFFLSTHSQQSCTDQTNREFYLEVLE